MEVVFDLVDELLPTTSQIRAADPFSSPWLDGYHRHHSQGSETSRRMANQRYDKAVGDDHNVGSG